MLIFRSVVLKKKKKINKEWKVKILVVFIVKDFKYNNKLGKGRNGGREGERGRGL